MDKKLGTLGHWRGGAQGRTGRRWARKAVVGMVCGAAAAGTLVVQSTPAGAIVPGPNGQIAFESSRSGDTDISVMGPNGSTQINLTADSPGLDVFPAWSPDGTKITFSSSRHNPPGLPFPNLDVFVMNADGSGVTQLTDSPGEDRGTSWTSDGQTIVFHSARDRDATHTFDIFKMNADGSNETKIFTNGSAAYVCGDSTNGIIVFNSSGDPLGTNPANGINPTTGLPIRDFEIFTMNMNGGDVFQVTNNTVIDSGPKWSPDCSM
ncbi:MAG: TolB family protein, partial [Acidimicrobiales bacterium]